MPLTEEQIARLEALEQRASETPWAPVHDALDESVESTTLGRFVCHLNTNMLRYHEDAELIAESRNLLPGLIAALRASQAEARALRLLAEGRAMLLVAYRLGTRAPEKAFKLIEQGETALAAQPEDGK